MGLIAHLDPRETRGAPPRDARAGFARVAAGRLAVALLGLVGRLPPGFAFFIGARFLPLYITFRRRTRALLRRLEPPVSARGYYRTRLRLALLSVRHNRGIQGDTTVSVEGSEYYDDALRSGKAVVLLGWHQGPVELLHRVPAAATPADRPFFLMTASAFAPGLTDWMTRGRSGPSRRVRVIRPGETAALRAWAKRRGTLAVMIDQVPGVPEDFFALQGGRVLVPWPRRLMSWLRRQSVEFLVVSVALQEPGRCLFRYERLALPADHATPGRSGQHPESGDAAFKDALSDALGRALSRAPAQYNWSYGKIRRGDAVASAI